LIFVDDGVFTPTAERHRRIYGSKRNGPGELHYRAAEFREGRKRKVEGRERKRR